MGRVTGFCRGVGLVPGVVCLGVEPPRGLVMAGVGPVSGSAVGSGVGSTIEALEFTFETDELSAFELFASIPLSTVGSGDGVETSDSSWVGSGEGSVPAAPGPKFI